MMYIIAALLPWIAIVPALAQPLVLVRDANDHLSAVESESEPGWRMDERQADAG
jgi:hypothetical protein